MGRPTPDPTKAPDVLKLLVAIRSIEEFKFENDEFQLENEELGDELGELAETGALVEELGHLLVVEGSPMEDLSKNADVLTNAGLVFAMVGGDGKPRLRTTELGAFRASVEDHEDLSANRLQVNRRIAERPDTRSFTLIIKSIGPKFLRSAGRRLWGELWREHSTRMDDHGQSPFTDSPDLIGEFLSNSRHRDLIPLSPRPSLRIARSVQVLGGLLAVGSSVALLAGGAVPALAAQAVLGVLALRSVAPIVESSRARLDEQAKCQNKLDRLTVELRNDENQVRGLHIDGSELDYEALEDVPRTEIPPPGPNDLPPNRGTGLEGPSR